MQRTNYIGENRINLGANAPLDFPLVIYIEPSGYCNFKCKFCPQSQSKSMKKDIMKFHTFKSIIDEMKEWNIQVSKMRICGTGEPLLNGELVNMLAYMAQAGIAKHSEMVTNGYLLNEETAIEAAKYLNRIVISVEGLDEEAYLDICGTRIHYNKLLSNIQSLYRNKSKCEIVAKIHTGAIKCENDRQSFYSMFKPISDLAVIENLSDMWPEFESELFTRKKEFRYELKEGDYPSPIEHKVCPQIFKALQIWADGDVTLCALDWQRKNSIGNIHDKSLYEMWNGSKANAIRIAHLNLKKDELEPCKYCKANDYVEIDNIDEYAAEIKERMLPTPPPRSTK